MDEKGIGMALLGEEKLVVVNQSDQHTVISFYAIIKQMEKYKLQLDYEIFSEIKEDETI